MKNMIINKLQKDSVGLAFKNHTPKGFKSIHPKDDRYATLYWGMFDEIHQTKSIEQYGNTLFNTRTGKITKFVASDTLYNKYQIDAAVFAWQVDPLAGKYPMQSPYQFGGNSPISGVDINGLEYYYAADGSFIGKIGDNTQVRLVNANDIKTVKAYVNWANNTKKPEYKEYATGKANSFSNDVGMSNEELNLRAYMTLIRIAEAGNTGNPLPYDAQYGGGKISNYKTHPNKLIKKWGNSSTAAGAYQFVFGTWNKLRIDLKLKDFSPMSQDKAAVEKIKERGGYDAVTTGNVENSNKKLKNEWSSLPGGVQQQMNTGESKTEFKECIFNELNDKSVIETPKGQLISPKN